MKIALFHNLYGEFSHGGAETVVRLMAEKLASEGQEIFLITTKPRGQAGKPRGQAGKPRGQAEPTSTVGADGLKIYYLNSYFYNLSDFSPFARAGWQIGNLLSGRKYWQIKKILNAEKPDLAITHNLMGLGWLTPVVIRRQKIRHEHFLHDIQLLHPSGLMLWGKEKIIDDLATRIYQALTRACFASPAKVISPSAWLLKMHKERKFFKNSEMAVEPFAWPAETVLSNVPLSAAETTVKTNSARNFLFIGQIEKQKGVFLLIKAFKKINNPDLSLTFAIRGGGQEIAAAKELAASDSRIRFLGPLSYGETENIKTASDCLIVPSLCYENSPTTIYGAHASGLPIIAANIGGIPEIMGENDKLFEPGSEEDLKEKIEEMAGN
jgi:glycosyltransferase involved in cell wall biosynthesis